MKNLLLFFLSAVLILNSCGEKGPENQFTVSGKLENAAGKLITLNKIEVNSMVAIDSVTIGENGEFELTSTTSTPTFYILKTSPNDYITLIMDSAESVTVTGNFDDLAKSYEVEGSEDCRLIKELDTQIQMTMAAIDSLGVIYQANQENPSLDSVKAELDKEFMKIIEAQKAYSINFIDSHTNSFTTLVALSQQVAPRSPVFDVHNDIAYFEKAAIALAERYPNSEDVKGLTDFIEKIKNPQTQAMAGNLGIGAEAPEIALPSPEGEMIKLSSLRGKYVLLDFWAGWCKPCRAENPNLVSTFRKYKSKNFDIFQVSLDQTKEMWTGAIKKDRLSSWKHVSDLKFWQSEAAALYNVRSIPASFLLDPEGKIIATNLRGPALGDKLKEIFGY